MHNQAISYRPEIDGLRAVAVIPVILFHAGLSLFSGGFVGVDVFFVISGYLITSIVISELESDRFSIMRFYERRARRVLPALFCVTLFCALFAWTAMMPGELERFGKSVAAVAGFMSNIYFWRTTDYFAPAAEDQLLLHTWSLAIEEQYYLFFPLLLMLVWRIGRNRLFWMAALAALVSLALAEWGSRHAPLADYYLLPTRAWELLGGSLLALMPAAWTERIRSRPDGARAGAWIGLALIVAAMLAFDRSTPFPGLYALLPVVGTVLVIACASADNGAGRLLSSRLFIEIGLRSYSAYLWHQPLLAIARKVYAGNPHLRLPLACAAILLTALLSAVTYRQVETPFRRHRTNKVIWISGSCLAGLFLFSLLLLQLSPLEHRPLGYLVQGNDNALDYLHWADENLDKATCPGRKDYGDYYTCELGDAGRNEATLVLWGDSLAGALVHGLDRKLRADGVRGLAYISDGCPPIPDLKRAVAPNCRANTHRQILDRIAADRQARDVLLLGNVTGGSRNKDVTIEGRPAAWSTAAVKIRDAAREIEAGGKRFFFVEQGPRFPTEAAAYYFHQALWGGSAPLSLSRAEHLAAVAQLRELDGAGVRYLRTDDFFCEAQRCTAAREGKLLIYDHEHYTFHGSALLAEYIVSRLALAALDGPKEPAGGLHAAHAVPIHK